MNFDERIVTDAPPAGAFLYLGNLTNSPSWDPNITTVEPLTPGIVGLGSRFQVTMRMLGISATLDYHVEVYEPDRRIIFIGRSLIAKVTDTILISPFRGGSRIRWAAEIHLFAPLVLVDPIVGIFVRPAITRAMASLEQCLNRFAVTMPPRTAWKDQPMPQFQVPPAARGVDGHRGIGAHHV